MKFGTLQIQNFLSISNSKINLSDRGFVCIQGINDDDSSAGSNGSGKSSIPDAVSWVLFGVTARGISGDDVINRKIGKKCSVSLQVIDDDAEYIITRSRKPNLLTLTSICDEVTADLTKGISADTQTEIERILGCSRDIFMATTYAGQENMPDLPGMTDKHLKELIEEAAGINALTAAYRIARERALDVKSAVGVIEKEIAAIEDNVSVFKAMKDNAVADFEEFKKRHNEAYLIEQSSKHDDIKEALDKKKEEHSKADEKLAANNSEFEKITSKSFEALTKLNTCKSDIVKISSQIEFAKKEISRENAELKAIVKAYEDGVCPECGQKLTEDIMEHRSGNKKAKLEKSREEHKAEALKYFKALHIKQAEEKELEQTLRDLTQQKDELGKKASILIDEEDVLKRQVTELNDQLMNAVKAKNDLENFNSLCEYRTNEIKKFEKQIDDGVCKLLLKKTDLVKKQGDETRINSVVEVFSPAGIRAYILDSVTPFLNERTAHYLNTLSGGNITAVWSTLARTKGGVLKEKFNISVVNRYGANSFNGLSGGEKRKVRLSCSLALQELVASRGTKRIDLFMADEIDNALDETSLQLLMDLMSEKAEQCGSLFVISHNSLNDMVDNIVTVRKHDGLSTIEE